jgi:hypothetical protein
MQAIISDLHWVAIGFMISTEEDSRGEGQGKKWLHHLRAFLQTKPVKRTGLLETPTINRFI